MVERRDPQYEETNNPKFPPKAVVNRDVRRATLWSFLGPLVVLFLVIGIALLYWMRREPGRNSDESVNPATGTSGQVEDRGVGRNTQQGGGSPTPRPNSTEDEIRFRGGNEGAAR